MTIKIDNDVPVPQKSGHGRNSKYPWREMEPGNSFFVPGVSTNEFSGVAAYGRTAVPGSKWATRTVTENGVTGVRVWRLT